MYINSVAFCICLQIRLYIQIQIDSAYSNTPLSLFKTKLEFFVTVPFYRVKEYFKKFDFIQCGVPSLTVEFSLSCTVSLSMVGDTLRLYFL
jgi:hypothetical protein